MRRQTNPNCENMDQVAKNPKHRNGGRPLITAPRFGNRKKASMRLSNASRNTYRDLFVSYPDRPVSCTLQPVQTVRSPLSSVATAARSAKSLAAEGITRCWVPFFTRYCTDHTPVSSRNTIFLRHHPHSLTNLTLGINCTLPLAVRVVRHLFHTWASLCCFPG